MRATAMRVSHAIEVANTLEIHHHQSCTTWVTSRSRYAAPPNAMLSPKRVRASMRHVAHKTCLEVSRQRRKVKNSCKGQTYRVNISDLDKNGYRTRECANVGHGMNVSWTIRN